MDNVLYAAMFMLLGQDLVVTCNKLTFVAMNGARHPANVIQRFGPVTEQVCQRACRLYSECYGVNMNWTDQDRGVGFCEILDVIDIRRRQPESMHAPEVGYSYYATCPASMTYFAEVDRCYYLDEQALSWNEANDLCQRIHPNCHLADLQRREEEDVLFGSTVIGGFWLGGRRPLDGKLTDILWIYSGLNVFDSYTNWADGDPDMNDNPAMHADCIRLWKPSTEINWADDPCYFQQKAACEF